MSWLPFRRQPKKGITENLSDSEFENQTEHFSKVEANTRKVYKDVKRHLDTNANLVKSQQRFAQDLQSNTIGLETDPKLFETSLHLQIALTKQSELHTETSSNIRKTFVEPLKKFSNNFNTVNGAIKRREQSLQDYSKYVNRREKFLEKESMAQSGKFDANERYLALAKADFERRNTKLLDELPKFYNCRMAYFEPCFEGLVKSQFQFFDRSRDIFEELSEKVDCPLEQWSEEQYREETAKKLAEIKTLSIVA